MSLSTIRAPCAESEAIAPGPARVRSRRALVRSRCEPRALSLVPSTRAERRRALSVLQRAASLGTCRARALGRARARPRDAPLGRPCRRRHGGRRCDARRADRRGRRRARCRTASRSGARSRVGATSAAALRSPSAARLSLGVRGGCHARDRIVGADRLAARGARGAEAEAHQAEGVSSFVRNSSST